MSLHRSHLVTRASWGVIAAAVALGGCGGEAADGVKPVSPAESEIRRVTVYFLTDDGVAALGRRRALGDGQSTADGALRLLLRGPNEPERQSGMTTAFPSRATVSSLEIGDRSREAVVELKDTPMPDSPVIRVRMIAQITRTLIRLLGIERVRIRIDGQPLGLLTQRGIVRDRSYDYEDLLGFYGICVGGREETVVTDCFSALP